jgi:hypothetical protein
MQDWYVGESIPIEVVILDPLTGLGATGLSASITLTVQRLSDGAWWGGASFEAGPVSLVMGEVSAANMPGLYRYTFTGNASAADRYEARARVSAPGIQGDVYELHVCRASSADSAWDELLAGHGTPGSAGAVLDGLRTRIG